MTVSSWHDMDELDEPSTPWGDEQGVDGVEFEHCICLAESRSGKAIMVKGVPGKPDGEWVPVSQLASGNEVRYDGDQGTLRVTRWLAEQKGWV